MLVVPLLATVALACPATPVHYEWNKLVPADPWVSLGRRSDAVVGQLATYKPTLGDRRVREAAGLTFYAGALHKIPWLLRRWEGAGRVLTVVAERTDGPGRLRYRFRRAVSPRFFPSGIRLPATGCWRLTLTTGSRRWVLYANAIEPPAERPCDPTGLGTGLNRIDPTFTTWIAATPATARIFGTISVSIPGLEGAATHTGGRKVLWLVDEPGGPLGVTGTRLDAPGAFRQVERAAASPPWAYPSTLVIPEAGCWLLRLRTSGRGGVVVMRALSP